MTVVFSQKRGLNFRLLQGEIHIVASPYNSEFYSARPNIFLLIENVIQCKTYLKQKSILKVEKNCRKGNLIGEQNKLKID